MTASNFDSELFQAMWWAGATQQQIGDALGLSVPQVNKQVATLRLPRHLKRDPSGARIEDKPEDSRHAEPKVPSMMPHPFWTPERDVMVLRTGGRYADIQALARVLGKTHQTVLGRWHALRAAGGRA